MGGKPCNCGLVVETERTCVKVVVAVVVVVVVVVDDVDVVVFVAVIYDFRVRVPGWS